MTSTPFPPPNPLSEANPASLDEYFSRNPYEMRKEDREHGTRNIATMVAEYARLRTKWKEAEAMGAIRAPKAPKAPKASPTLADLGLED